MDVDDLTDEQQNALIHFQEVTQIDSTETCRQYLAAHDWNVERAIETALVSESDSTFSRQSSDERITTDQFPSAPPMPEPFRGDSSISTAPRYVPNNNRNDQLTLFASLPLFRIILAFFYTLYLKIQPFIPWAWLYVFISFFRSLFWNTQSVDPIREIDGYCTYFNNKYGSQHPVFYRGRLSQALSDARREVRLLFIYLHEKNSPLSDRFCREVLCGEAFQASLENNLLWSASTDTREGAEASQLFRARSFPCLCIVAHQGSQKMVQLKLDRYTDRDECLAEIINGVQHANQILQYDREQRDERSSRVRLRDEQDAAYLDSVRADEEKAKQRAREEEERRKLEEDLRRSEEEERRKLQEFADFRDRIRRTIPAEPSASETDTIQVSIRLPSTDPIRRRFRRSDPAKLLFEFAWTDSNVPDQFELLWGYPRKRYQYSQIGDKIIGDVMSGNSETCYLEQIDDEK